MKSKIFKRFITMGVTTTLLLSMLTGCSNESTMMSTTDVVAESYGDTVGLSSGYVPDEDEINPSDSIAAQESDVDAADNESKLVYESAVSIDTLDFEKSVKLFVKLVDEYDGFFESKYMSDDGDNGSYIYEQDYGYTHSYDGEDHRYMTSDVRIPSDKYEAFMSETSSIGDVRSSSENVINMTQTYGTLQAQLEVYETEYNNYMSMLSTAQDENAILTIRDKLTELSVSIATIKSQMSTIDTDVEYSTISVSINEVEIYMDDSEKSTFSSRLKNAFEDSWDGCKDFLESLLFFFILEWYKILFIIGIIFIIVKVVKRNAKKKKEKTIKKEKVIENNNSSPKSEANKQ